MSLSTITQPITFRNLRFLCSAILLAGLPFSLLVAAPTLDANLTDPVAKGSSVDGTFANTFWPFAAEAKPLSCPTSITIGFAPALYCTNTQGVLSVNPVGGTFTSPTYQWSASNSRVTISNLTSATPDIDYILSGTVSISVTVTDGGSCGTFTASQAITVSSTPEPTITIPSTEVCQGNTINNITGAPSGSTRQWTVNNFSVGNPFGTFSAPTNQTTNFTANHAGNAEIFYEVTTTAGCTGTSEAQPITIFSPVVATAAVQSGNQPNVCADATLTLAASATGGNGSYTYEWEYMGGTQVVPTFVNASILLDNVNATNPVLTPVGTASDGDTYIFRVKATDGITCNDFSDNITITVRKITSAALSITGASTICEAGTTTFKVDVTRGNSGGSPTYTLVYNDGTADITVNNYVSGSSITTNAQSADCSLSIVSITDARVTVSNCSSPSNGSPATVTVNNLTAGSISGSATICSGDDLAAFGSSAATGDGAITYLWESSTDGTSFSSTGITTETLDPAALTADTWYRRVATSTLSTVPCSKTSNTILVTVNNLTAGVIAVDQTICSDNDVASFTVATAATGDGTLSYQWQISTDGGTMWNDINTATAATYDEGTLTADAQYRRITTSTLSSVACTATSNVITVTVNNVTAGAIAGDQTICSTENAAAFTEAPAATGDGTLSYQWQISTDGGAMWNDINTATAATYDEGALTADAQYRRITTSTLSSVACTATSNVITVTVNNITAGVIAGDQTICSGQTASFTQTTAATHDGIISYVWESSTDGGMNWISALPAGTDATYTSGALTQNTKFRRKDISSFNSVACNAYTNELTVTVQTTTGGILYVNDATGDDANLGTENCPKKTIQAAVTAAADGDIINVAAGTYTENVTINKRVTIDGAGSGTLPTINTIITAAAANSPTIYIQAGGASATQRLILKDLHITGASGGTGNENSGIRMQPAVEANGLSFVTFDNIACFGNTGHGFVFNASNSSGADLVINASAFVNNGAAGIKLAGGVALDGFKLENSLVSDNASFGLVVNDLGNDNYGGTNFQILNTDFIGNGTLGATGAARNGNVNIGRFNGNITVDAVTIDGQSAGADHGFSIGGKNATAPAGTMTFSNLTIQGNFVRPALAATNAGGQGRAFSIKGYTNVDNVSFNNVELLNTTGNNLEVMGITNVLNIGNTTFSVPSATAIGTGAAPSGENDGTRKMYSIVTRVTTSNASGKSPINATGAVFTGLNASVLAEAFDISDRVFDAVDDNTRGLVRIKTNEVFVTPNSFDLATTTPSVQRGVDAATANDIVNVEAGTYTETVTINKSLDIRGANYNVACGSRLSESVIAPSSGLPVSITADGVTFNGFEITAPGYQYAILCGNTNNLEISFNNIHHINSSATPALTPTHAIQYTVPNAPAAKSNVSVTDNCINNIGSVNLTGNSATAMGFLQSTTTGTLTGLTIARNTISDVTVSNAVWPTGKIAYGIQLNAGSANFKTTTGKIVNATINDNVISELSGHIATGIALEGNTENAVVTGNAVSDLTSTKNGDRAAGGVDLNGLKFETNRFVSTCTVENNSFETTTFNSALGNGVGYGVANYVPMADGGTALVTCNWFGTTSASVIADNAGLTGKILNKANCSTTFQPSYLVSGIDDNAAIGFQPEPGTCTGTTPVISFDSKQNITCFGGNNGAINITITGGTAPFSFNWTGPNGYTNITDEDLVGLTDGGTYNLTLTDVNGSTATFTESITAPAAAVTAVVANVDILCNGDITGTITVSNPAGGYGTYETSIDGTNWFAVTTGMPYTFSGLAAGLYDVQVRDAVEITCVTDLDGVGDTEISQPEALTVSAVAAAAVLSCNNGATTTITATPSGGTGAYSYVWSPSGGTMATTSPVGVGSYTVVVTDENNCQVTSSAVTISNPSHPGDGIWYVNDNSLTGDVLTTAVGNNANIGTASCPFATINHAISQASPGDMIKVDAGTFAENITVNKRLDINGVGDATIIQNTGNTVFTYTAAGSGTDAVNRAYLRDVKVSGSSRGLLAGQVVNHLTLDDVTFDGNTSYAIHVNNTSGVMNDWEITNCTFNANSAGLYVATAANIDGVSVTGSTFTNQTGSSIYVGQHSSTPGGFSNVTITGNTFTDNGPANNQAAFYLEKLTNVVISGNTMTNNGLSTNPRGIIANLKHGAYTNVSITDNTIMETRGGVQTNGYGINVQGRNDAPAYNSNPGSLADVTITGNEISGIRTGIEIDNDVNWNFTTIENNKVSGADYGVLGVVYGTGNTANATTTMNVHENSILANTFVVGNFNTNGGTIDAECNWYGTVNGSTIASKMSGTVDYSPWLVSGMDDDLLTIGFQPVSGACSATAVEVTATQTNITGCFGDATGAIDITVTGGVPDFTYAWSNGATTEDLTGLTAGTYTVTVTDGLGTTGTLSVTITQPDAVVAIGTPSHVSCFGGNNGSITLMVTGGTGSYTYDWNGMPTGDGTATITGLTAGTYTVTVTDANSCTGITSVTVTEPVTAVSASITGSTNVSCNGGNNGTATVAPAGGTPGYTYTWSNAQTGATATGLTAGTYTVTVTDLNNCVATASVTIMEPAALMASITAQTNVSCYGGYNGSATVTAVGGTMPYDYDWFFAYGATITDVSAGIYTVFVTDAQGCMTTAVATITQPDALSLMTSQTNVTCNGGTNGTATVTPDGGTTPYTYDWNGTPTGDGTATITGLTAGTYTVTVTDANGCSGTTSVSITQPAVLTIATSPTSATATATCGTTAAVDAEFVAWNTGVTYTGGAAPITVTENYTVTTDVNGALVETYNGTEPTAPSADGGYTVVTWTVTDDCGNTATVSATFTVNNCMRISGALKYYRDDVGVDGINVDMVGTGANDGISAGGGLYTVYSNTTGNFDVIPASIRVCEPCTTGTTVSTADLKDIYNISVEDVDAIKAHIAAGAQFDDIYQRAAANVVLGTTASQTNNRLTSADATALSQAINGSLTQQGRLSRRSIPHDEDLIAGAPDPLPRSWGLVPVLNAGNLAPAQYGDFTQKRNYPTLDGAFTDQDFVVLQVGDVTDHNSLRGENADARYAGSPLIWKVKDAELTEGEVIDAAFTIEQMQNLRGWQFGLQFDPEYLKVDTLTTTNALPLDPEVNFGLYQAEMGEIRSLWADGVTKSLNQGESVFTLRFTALQGGKNLSDVLKLEEGAATYALTDQRDQVAVMLSFDGQVRAGQAPVLHQNTPNPFDKETSVRFELPEASDIQLTIHDVNGRLINELNGYYSQGLHEVRFERGEFGQYAGVLYYTLRSGDFIATRKMVIID